DTAVKAEGAASLRVDAKGPVTVRLYEVRDPGVENARLLYQARLRTKDLKGQAYLEMWCRFPGLGEYFSRALQAPVSGTTVWTIQETPFFLQKGQKPDLVKLNLVVEGAGTVWIDDVRLTQGPPR
ncbi:MAG: hypothetical protein KC466_19675, partial [Myxococcales bacterium]|nr:hypothetical protein [Myxococcales bacterium]